jgi:hypothetical protein
VADLIITTDGVEKHYPVEDILARVTMADLLALVAATGMSYNDMARGLQELAPMGPEQIMRRADLLQALTAFIWFARRHAGEKLTYQESNDILWDDFAFEEDEEADAEPDPTPAVAVKVAAKATPRTAKATSRRKSVAA